MKHHFTGFGFVDCFDHRRRNRAGLFARHGIVRRVAQWKVSFNACNVASNTRNDRIDEMIDFDVFECENAQRDVAHVIVAATGQS